MTSEYASTKPETVSEPIRPLAVGIATASLLPSKFLVLVRAVSVRLAGVMVPMLPLADVGKV